MTKRQFFIYLGILLFGIFAGIYILKTFGSKTDTSSYERKLDSLTTVINHNNVRIDQQDYKLLIFEKHVTKVDSQNVVYYSTIKKLNKNANIKIKAVDNFTNDSLFHSISSRYK